MSIQKFIRWGEACIVSRKLPGFWHTVFDKDSGEWVLYRQNDGQEEYASEEDCRPHQKWFTPGSKPEPWRAPTDD